MKNSNQLKMGAVLSYVSIALTTVISLLYTPIMLRILGQSEYGLYNLSQSIIGYLGILDLGLGNAVIRYVAKYRTLNEKENESNLYGMFLVIYTLLSLITVVVGMVLLNSTERIFANSLTNAELDRMKILIAIMVINLAISFPFSVFSGIITAYEHFIVPKIIAIVRAIINPIVMLPLLYMGYLSVGMSVVTTLINIICIGINLFYCFRVLKIKVKFNKFDFTVLKEISGYSYYIFLNIIVDKIYWSTDQFILGAVSGTTAVAVYSVAATINNYYLNLSKAISGVFLPKVTAMVTRGVSDRELSNLFIRVGRIQFIVMSYILGGFFVVGKEFIIVWAGKEYLDAYYIILLLIVPLTVPLIQNIGITILQAKNMHKFRSNVYLVIALMNIILTIYLSRIYGGIGAALSTAISMIIGNIIIINIYYYKQLHIDIPNFWKEIFRIFICFASSVVLTNWIMHDICYYGYTKIIINGFVYTLIFTGSVWKNGMNNHEKMLVREPLEKILKVKRG